MDRLLIFDKLPILAFGAIVIGVTIVEDHKDFREGLERVIQDSTALCLRSSHPDCETFLDVVKANRNEMPEVVLMDIGLPGISGIECLCQVKSLVPEMEIVILTVMTDATKVLDAIMKGAAGYLLKTASNQEIVDAVKVVAKGGSYMTPTIARKVLKIVRELSRAEESKETSLTPRELEVLQLLVAGLDYKAIATQLYISLDTVRNHIRHIYEKLQVHSKSQAVAKALQRRIV